MNNIAVPMDTSNRARAPRQQGNQGGRAYGNAVQADQGPPKQWPPRKCFTCNRVGHLARDCRAKNAQINSVINEPEDMSNVQALITPEGILDNALSMFDRLSEDMKCYRRLTATPSSDLNTQVGLYRDEQEALRVGVLLLATLAGSVE